MPTNAMFDGLSGARRGAQGSGAFGIVNAMERIKGIQDRDRAREKQMAIDLDFQKAINEESTKRATDKVYNQQMKAIDKKYPAWRNDMQQYSLYQNEGVISRKIASRLNDPGFNEKIDSYFIQKSKESYEAGDYSGALDSLNRGARAAQETKMKAEEEARRQKVKDDRNTRLNESFAEADISSTEEFSKKGNVVAARRSFMDSVPDNTDPAMTMQAWNNQKASLLEVAKGNKVVDQNAKGTPNYYSNLAQGALDKVGVDHADIIEGIDWNSMSVNGVFSKTFPYTKNVDANTYKTGLKHLQAAFFEEKAAQTKNIIEGATNLNAYEAAGGNTTVAGSKEKPMYTSNSKDGFFTYTASQDMESGSFKHVTVNVDTGNGVMILTDSGKKQVPVEAITSGNGLSTPVYMQKIRDPKTGETKDVAMNRADMLKLTERSLMNTDNPITDDPNVLGNDFEKLAKEYEFRFNKIKAKNDKKAGITEVRPFASEAMFSDSSKTIKGRNPTQEETQLKVMAEKMRSYKTAIRYAGKDPGFLEGMFPFGSANALPDTRKQVKMIAPYVMLLRDNVMMLHAFDSKYGKK